jgi:Family of unknown function (DUF6111)
MLRLVVENILLFLAPTLLYVAFVLLRRSPDQTADGTGAPDQAAPGGSASPNINDVLSDAPFIWLALTGAALVFAVLLLFGSVSTSDPNGTYEPAIYKDGKIIPGRIK